MTIRQKRNKEVNKMADRSFPDTETPVPAGRPIEFRIIEGAEGISSLEVAALLKTTYWANQRSLETIEKSMRHSSCYGVYLTREKKLAGFARVISDYATTFYLCDVVVDPEYRHRGLGKALIAHITALPEFRDLRGLLLTRDAHGLYEKSGFVTVSGTAMTRSPEALPRRD